MAKAPQKRLGKKHRHASSRPKQGATPRAAKLSERTTSSVSPKQRKELATKKRLLALGRLKTKQSPELESKKNIQERPRRDYSAAITQPREKTPMHLNALADVENEKAIAHMLPLIEERQRTSDPVALPLIAICGRPNVGKSTLFNRLTGTRRSIVGDEPGITRDRIYGEIEWQNRNARLVDTGGVIPDDEALIPSEIFRQARVALEEADAVILVVDGRTELASPDVDLSRLLMRTGKPLFLAVNKMDTAAITPQAENFRTLGVKELFPISAEHNNGVYDLLDAVFEALPAEVDTEEEQHDDSDFEEGDEEIKPERKLRSHGEHISRETKVAIIGRPNVGKSTLLNALTNTSRSIVSPIAGTTRDAVDESVVRKGHTFKFVDTAGIRRKGKTTEMAEKLSVIMARKHLEAADVALLIIDATEGVTALDANIGGYAHESGRSVVIVINKWDAVTTNRTDGKAPADIKAYSQQVRDALKYLDYAPMVFISAQNKTNVNSVFREVEMVAKERRKRVSTGMINKFLSEVDFQRASVPMNKRVKIYYMTQAAVAPPTFILFTDRDVKLHFGFERFLENEIRRAWGFAGTPIWFKVRARNKKKEE